MDIKQLVRKNILDLKPYTSARDVYSSGILLDANENSWGSTYNGAPDLHLNRYPDPHQKDLKKAVSDLYGYNQNNLFFGVGSDEIIDLLIRIFCQPAKDKVLIPRPTYGMYRVCSDINGTAVIEVLLKENFQIDLSAIEKKYEESVKIIFLCSPNNPTGNLLSKKDIVSLCEKYNSIIIVDEAYIDFAEGGSVADEIESYPNLVVLRTFSKAWGLAGIRLGYCIAGEEITNLLFKVKAPYNINTLTRSALEKALSNYEKKNEYVSSIIRERERLKNQLETLIGVQKIYESDANFLLLKCENPKDVQKQLAEKRIIVRDRSSEPMLEGCLRISIGNEEENDILWEAISKIL